MGYLAAFAGGAADEYLTQRTEDRKEGREIKKEKRVVEFQKLRDKRLAEIDKTTASTLVKTDESAAVSSDKRREDAAISATARKRMDPIEVSASASIATPKEGGGYDFAQAPAKPPSATSSGQFTAEDATKFFSKRGDVYFGTLDESGLYTLGTDENAQLASAASSVANRLWLKKGGRVDANTIWAIVYKNIKSKKAATAADIAKIGDELNRFDDMWWNNEADDAEVKKLKKEAEDREAAGKSGQMDLPGANAGNAPQRAIDALTADRSLAPDFQKKYGYLPPGF